MNKVPLEKIKKRKEIGRRISDARRKKNLNQFELSELLDISTCHMSDIERGDTNVGLDIFMNITQVLQVSADWLLGIDLPQVKCQLNNEISELLEDCSVSEINTLLKLMKEIKVAIRQQS